MADDQPPRTPDGPSEPSPGAGQGWQAVGYLITGIAVWGFVGWLVDKWLGTDGIAAAVGSIVGAAGGIYLVVRRIGT